MDPALPFSMVMWGISAIWCTGASRSGRATADKYVLCKLDSSKPLRNIPEYGQSRIAVGS